MKLLAMTICVSILEAAWRISMKGKKKADRLQEQAVCQKNDIVTLEIIDMGTEGEGIARLDGYTLFVKDALAGDTIKA